MRLNDQMKYIIRHLALIATAAVGFPPASLADTTISGATSTTQTINGTSGNNNITVTSSGSISTTSNATPGIRATGSSNTITNYGTITTTGNGSAAITADSSSIITNAGSLRAYGTFGARGISVSGSNNNILNSGDISVSGSAGIRALAAQNTITNTGTITASGDGIRAINTTGGSNTIINSGSITTTGKVDGTDMPDGILIDGDNNNVTNSGSIISHNGRSIAFTGSGNTLNLLNSSFLGGNIALGTGTQINVATGANYSKLINYSGTLSGISATGPIPVFVNQSTKQLATYDPTLFAATSDALGDMTSTISSLTPGRFNGTDKEHPLWARGFGMTASYTGSEATLARNYNYSGAAMGYDFKRSNTLILGVLGGYGQTSLTTNGTAMQSYNSSSDDGFLGLYGQKRWKNLWLDFALYGGVQVFNQQRYINDNLAYLGNASAQASFSGSWLAPEAGFTFKAAEVSGWSLLPTARLRYAQQWMNGYTETGGTGANASVSGRNVTLGQSFVGVGTRKSIKTRVGKNTKMVLEGQIGYLYRGAVGDVSADVAMIGQSLSLPTEVSSRNAVAASAGVTIDLSNTVALKIRGDAAAGGGMNYVGGGWAGLSAKF